MNDGYTDLPPGKLAAVVTYLEMRTPADATPTTSGFAIRQVENADLDWYRKLFREIGGPWLWFSRLRMSDDELRAVLHHPHIDIFILSHNGVDGGLLEFDRRKMPDIEILYFGVTPSLLGKGAGRALLEHCLPLEWVHHPKRIWLHTCTWDHPKALSFYIKAGFVPYKRGLEIADDPRVTGVLPRDAAPEVPIL
ncbi:MAG: GNAT family N-acetyltransferase [Candidatus Korobacteraceae bacterium]